MGKKIKFVFSIVVVFCLIAVYYWYASRIVSVQIASVTFHVPNSSIVSTSYAEDFDRGLDRNQGAFLQFPEGPYHGNWGIFLQSSSERKAGGFPAQIAAALTTIAGAGAFLEGTQMPFGWYKCHEKCVGSNWYFRRVPILGDSIYSVESMVCYDTGFCELFFAYRDVDVAISIQPDQIDRVPDVIKQASSKLSNMDVERGKVEKK
jgi:hypothetical protein